jgi:urea transport system permease protein
VGAFLVNGMKSWLTVTAPEFWLYFLGALFIGVTLYMPHGITGALKGLIQKLSAKKNAEERA